MHEDLDIIFLIDRSGSMCGSEKDTIGGFNSYINREKNKEFNTKITQYFLIISMKYYTQENQ